MEPSWGRRLSVVAAIALLGGACTKKSDEAAAVAPAPQEVDKTVAEESGAKRPSAAATAAPMDPEDGRGDGPKGSIGGLGVGARPGRGKVATGRADALNGEGERGGAAVMPPSPPAQMAQPNKPGDSIAPGAAGPLIPIDPNGRFATTYRPGGGHLAAFESAVARGIIPTGEREVVSDVGARYVTAFDVPKGKAMAVRADFERAKLQPGGGPFHVRVSLRSTADKAAERPHLSVHLVLDVSGSMAGESIVRAREAARALVDKLGPNDDFSLVTFSSDAEVKVPDGPVGARREQIKKTIEGVREGGGTNIGKGLELGYREAETKSIPADAVKVVLLLSDGRANVGVTAHEKLSKMALDAFQKGIQTSSFGLGPDYDGALMSSIASEGAGGYYYLRDAEQIAPALATELDKRLDPVASAVEVRVRLKKGVELLHVYGSRRLTEAEAARVRAQEVAADQQAEKRDKIAKDRQDDTEGGMRFFLPAFARDDAHALLLQLKVPAGAGKKPVAMVEIKYKDRVSKKNVSDEFPIGVEYADSDAASAGSVDASVARTVQGFAAGEALADAAARVSRGDRAGAVALLAEREQILRKASETLGEPLFLKDADRLARLRQHAGSETGLGDPLVLSMMLETAGRAHLR